MYFRSDVISGYITRIVGVNISVIFGAVRGRAENTQRSTSTMPIEIEAIPLATRVRRYGFLRRDTRKKRHKIKDANKHKNHNLWKILQPKACAKISRAKQTGNHWSVVERVCK